MTNTRNRLMILILPFIFASSSALADFSDDYSHACEKSIGDIIKVYPTPAAPFRQAEATARDGDQCSEIPDAYRISIYKFGTCTEDPFATRDFSTCSYFIDSNDTPVTHIIEGVGVRKPLAMTGVIAPGTYGYGFMILSNSLEIKHTQTYSADMRSNPNGNGEFSGPTCWSIDYTTTFGSEIPAYETKGRYDDTGIKCGATVDALPEFTKEIFDTMGDGSFLATEPGEFTLPSGDKMRAKLLESDNTTEATSAAGAARIFARINFATDKVVTASSQFEIKFKLTDAVSVDSDHNGGNPYIVKMGADPFQVDVVVTD